LIRFLLSLLSTLLIIVVTTACAINNNQVEEGVTVSKVKLFISEDEFNSKFKQDPDENQFQEGKFELMDGSIVNADFFSYRKSAMFDYATAIFFEDELASLHLETTLSIEEIESLLGMKFEGIAIAEPNSLGYQITFHSMFHESNISVYPFEWEE
jgi:hypothetical protein